MSATIYNPLPLIAYRAVVVAVGAIVAGYLIRKGKRRPFGWFTFGAVLGVAWPVCDSFCAAYVARGIYFDSSVFWLPWIGMLLGLIIEVCCDPPKQRKRQLLTGLLACALFAGLALSIAKERRYVAFSWQAVKHALMKARGDPTLQEYR